MINEKYDNALKLMLAANEELAKRINEFIEKIPDRVKKKIEEHYEQGKVVHEGNIWSFYNSGKDLSISVGSEKNNNRDYMSLYLNLLHREDLSSMRSYNEEKLVGFVVFYLYGDHRKTKPLQLNYDVYVCKKQNRHLLTLSTRVNPYFKDNAQLIKDNGFDEVVKSISNKRCFTINLDEVLPNKKR